MTPEQLEQLNLQAPVLSLKERIGAIAKAMQGRVVFTTSFGLEDQLLTDAICATGAPVDIVTLDTGRLFPETYDVWSRTEAKYDLRIKPFYPEADATERLVASQGINGFTASVDQRKACCFVRKVEPLGRALSGYGGWVTGLRAGQSAARQQTVFAEADPQRDLIKFNPLFDFDRDAIALHVQALEIPYNALHDKGFLSIGCAPCTRAVRVGEPERAGRWWWEASSQECGLHEASQP